MTQRQFQVRKDDLSDTRLVDGPLPELSDGEVLAQVERFALTANNITYGIVGERIGYWNFFPPLNNDDGGWGMIPAWGFAEVVQSRMAEVPEGSWLYGYFPTATHLVMRPTGVSTRGLIDASAHRQVLPPVYNGYARVGAPSGDTVEDDERALLQPLYLTSYCLHDFFAGNDWFGARQLVVVGASSKTAIGVAYALADDENAPRSIAVTSGRNGDMVRALGIYDTVLSYDALDAIDNTVPTAIIDLSGSGPVLSDLHTHLGDRMRYCSNVGVTHWSENEMGPGFIRERSAMFFAPEHIRKRATEIGAREFEQQADAFWRAAAHKSRSWLTIEAVRGLDDMPLVFDALRGGKIAAQTGLAVHLDGGPDRGHG